MLQCPPDLEACCQGQPADRRRSCPPRTHQHGPPCGTNMTVMWIRIRIMGDLLDQNPQRGCGSRRQKLSKTVPKVTKNKHKIYYFPCKLCIIIFVLSGQLFTPWIRINISITTQQDPPHCKTDTVNSSIMERSRNNNQCTQSFI